MASDQQFCLRWNNHQNTLVSILDSLLDSGTLVDCTLAAEGRFLQAHKVVLSACSPYFAMLLREHYDKFPILILKDIKYQELQAMMNYMYRGEVNITQETLGSFLKAAESLQIRGLTDNSNNNHCVENNNGVVRDGATHPYHSSSNSSKKLILPDSRKLVVPPHTPPLLSQQSQPSPLQPQQSPLQPQQPPPLPPQQRSRSPQAAALLGQQLHKKYLKSPAAILENHHNPGAAAASKSSESSSLDPSCSSSSTKRRKLLPPIKSESLVVTPINPVAVAAAVSTYNNLDVNCSSLSGSHNNNNNEVPSQQPQLPPDTKANMVASPSGPPKVESPHMDVSPVATVPPNKVSSSAVGAEPPIKPKPLAELVKVKSEQLDDSFNEDTNDDSQNTEENCDIDRDENSQLGGSMSFTNSQSGPNFEGLERSLVSQDGSLQDASDARAADEIVSQFVIKLSDSMPIDYCLATTLCEPSLSAATATTTSSPTAALSPATAVTAPSPVAGAIASPPAAAVTSSAADSMTLTMTFATTLTAAAANPATVSPSAGTSASLASSPLLALPSPQSLLQLQQQHPQQPLPLALSALGLPSAASSFAGSLVAAAPVKATQPLAPSKAFFPCDNCGNVYNYKTSLARHVRFECGKDPQFKCPFCEHRTKHKSSLTTHIDCKHRQELLFDENRYWREFYSLTKTQ